MGNIFSVVVFQIFNQCPVQLVFIAPITVYNCFLFVG